MESNLQGKHLARFQRFQQTLDPASQCQLDGLVTLASAAESDPREIEAFRSGLPESVTVALDHVGLEGMPAAVEKNGSGYCLIEAPDGEFPALRMFYTLEGLVERLTKLVGQDVVAYPFFGTPLPISKGPDRFLLLPNDKAVAITKQQHRVDLSEEDVEVEESGYLGPGALSIPAPSYVDDESDESRGVRRVIDVDLADDDEDDDCPDPAS